jgi:hypothetical protein
MPEGAPPRPDNQRPAHTTSRTPWPMCPHHSSAPPFKDSS